MFHSSAGLSEGHRGSQSGMKLNVDKREQLNNGSVEFGFNGNVEMVGKSEESMGMGVRGSETREQEKSKQATISTAASQFPLRSLCE